MLTFVIGVLVGLWSGSIQPTRIAPFANKRDRLLAKATLVPPSTTRFFCRSFQEAPGSGGTGRCGEPPWKTGPDLGFFVTQQFTVGTSVTTYFQGAESCSISLSLCQSVNHHTLKVREGSYPFGHAISNLLREEVAWPEARKTLKGQGPCWGGL